jgi:4'-phosphopantetheinyl transferase
MSTRPVPAPGFRSQGRSTSGRSVPESGSVVRVEVHLLRLANLRHGDGAGVDRSGLSRVENRASLAALPEEERRFAAGIASRSRRDSFLAARRFLREMAARRLGRDPASLPIVRRSDGKPRLATGEIEFSLSRAGGWIGVALSSDCEVGVDVEPERPLAGMDEIASEFFPPAARAAFAAASANRQTTVFFRWWTRVEAAVKATGRSLDDGRHSLDGVSFESCDLIPGLAATVAARAEGPLIVDWHVAPADLDD